MKRREFITLIGGAATAWPITGRAQQRTETAIYREVTGKRPNKKKRRAGRAW